MSEMSRERRRRRVVAGVVVAAMAVGAVAIVIVMPGWVSGIVLVGVLLMFGVLYGRLMLGATPRRFLEEWWRGPGRRR